MQTEIMCNGNANGHFGPMQMQDYDIVVCALNAIYYI